VSKGVDRVLDRSSLPAKGAAAGGVHAAAASAADRMRSAGSGALFSALVRLEEVVDQETAALKGHVAIDLKAFNDRKNQALLELSRALRQLQGAPPDAALTVQLGSLRSKLEVNRAVLKLHVEAVREISATLSDAIRDADSDGTYSQAAIRSAYKQQ
jgi:hypothetical protein